MKRGYQYGGLTAERYAELLRQSPELAAREAQQAGISTGGLSPEQYASVIQTPDMFQREPRYVGVMSESMALDAAGAAQAPISTDRTAFDQREAEMVAAEQALEEGRKQRRLEELRVLKARQDAAAQGIDASDYSDLMAYYQSEIDAPANRAAQDEALLQQAAAADAQLGPSGGASSAGLMSQEDFMAAMSRPVEPVMAFNPPSASAPSSVEPVAPTPGLMERLDSAQASIDSAQQTASRLNTEIQKQKEEVDAFIAGNEFTPEADEIIDRRDDDFDTLATIALMAQDGRPLENIDGRPSPVAVTLMLPPKDPTSSPLERSLGGINEALASSQGLDLQELVDQRKKEMLATGEMRPAVSPELRQLLFALELQEKAKAAGRDIPATALPDLSDLREVEAYAKAIRENALDISDVLDLARQAREGIEANIYDGRISYDQVLEAIDLQRTVNKGVRNVIKGKDITYTEQGATVGAGTMAGGMEPVDPTAPLYDVDEITSEKKRGVISFAKGSGREGGTRSSALFFDENGIPEIQHGNALGLDFVADTDVSGSRLADTVRIVAGKDVVINPEGVTLQEYNDAKAKLEASPLGMFSIPALQEFARYTDPASGPGKVFAERAQKGFERSFNKGGLMQPTGYNDGGYVRLPRTNLDAYAQRVMENQRVADMQRTYDAFNRPDPESSAALGTTAAEFAPVVGDVMAFTDAAQIAADPNASDFAKAAAFGLAGLGLVPVVGDIASKAGRTAIRRGMQDDAIRIQEDPTIPTTRAAELDTLRAREGFAASQQEMSDPNFPAVPGYQYQSIPIEYPELLPLPEQPPIRTLERGVTGFDPTEAAQYRDARVLVEQENARRLAEYDAARQQQIQADIAMRERSVPAQQPAATEVPAPTPPQEAGLMSNPTAERARPPAMPQRGTMGDRERMNQELGEAVAALEALDAPKAAVRDVVAETDQMIKEADDLVDQITNTDTSAKRGFGGFSINNLEDLTDQWSRGSITDSEYRSQLRSMGVRIGGLKGNVDLDPSALVFELPDGKRVRGIDNI